MKIYFKHWQTLIPGSIDSVWDYFSDPANLQHITPEYMKFNIFSEVDHLQVYPGMLIRYQVSPIANIPMNWVTEITSVLPKVYFIDEQRFGPYKLWHHEHRFVESNNGVIMTDNLHYAIPFGLLGQFINKITIDRRIDDIFDYRQNAIDQLFKGR